MNRQEAIAILKDISWQMGSVKRLENIEAIEMAIAALQDDWIPCSERLPEEDKDVLVTVHFMGLKQTHPNGWNDHIKPNYYVDIASRIDEEWSSASDEYKIARNRHKIIAWRPLPAPYKESEE